MRLSPVFLVALMCTAEVLTMLGVFTFPALLPGFLAEWGLDRTEAGWIAGATFAGYALSVPVLIGLTDRVDARRVYVAGAGLTALALAGFAFSAQGFAGALIWRLLAGIGLAATYMQGVRAIADRYDGKGLPRGVAFYTASFSLGTAASFYLSGMLDGLLGWRATFAVAAGAAALAGVLVAVLLPPVRPGRAAGQGSFLDFRPVFRNRAAMGFILAYAAHNWELFAFRSWLVAFLAFSLTVQPAGQGGWPAPALVAAISALIAMLASIGGGEAADRWGRKRMIAAYMTVSGLMGLVVGFLPGLSYGWVIALMFLYTTAIQTDSAALTTGTLLAAEPGRRGATLGLHALVGFGGGALGPLAVGLVLDSTGGGADALSWGLGFAAMGSAAFLGPLAFFLLRRRTPPTAIV